MITAAKNSQNDTSGDGKYSPLLRNRKKSDIKEAQEFVYLDKIDSRMRFNNSKDPIYFAFECLDKRSLGQLATDFVQESFFEIANFVSKIVK